MACAFSRLFTDSQVHVLARDAEQLALIRCLADAAYPGHRLVGEVLRAPPFAALRRSKLLVLLANRDRLQQFDALVLPERTSLALRRFGVTRPRFVHVFHGASGHDRADDPRLRRFDLLLAPSARRLERIEAAGPLPPGRSAVVGYGKLDLVRRLGLERPAPFGNGRPTVLYNPHHRNGTSSWPAMGRQVLDFFAASSRYNLIFAPHVRLFDPPSVHESAFQRYAAYPNIRVDLGSLASIDMSHALAADLYLGDISSQVFEFLIRPRPCVFLNPHRLAWHGKPDYAAWELGQVVEDLAGMERALEEATARQPRYEAAQRRAFEENFPPGDVPAPERAARVLEEFLRVGHLPLHVSEVVPENCGGGGGGP